MAHEWRDVFSTQFMSNWLAQVDNRFGANSTEYALLQNLGADICAYHKIPKTAYNKLAQRRKWLKKIARYAHRLIKHLSLANEAHSARAVVQQNYMDLDTQTVKTRTYSPYDIQNVGRTLLTIERRALRKAAYLKVLKKYYSAKQQRNVALTKLHLGAPQMENGQLIGLDPGVRLEQLDPVHRGFEVEPSDQIKDASGRIIGINSNMRGDPYHLAFMNWFNSEPSIPFFLYLEGTDLCLDDDKMASGNTEVSKVAYYRVDKKKVSKDDRESRVRICHVGAGGLIWFEDPLQTSKAPQPADTRDYTGKAGNGWAAYAFSEHYDLFIAKHEPNALHHSSFLSGHPLRCAGMIRIKNGKVTGVNSHSGHYRPKPRHLYNFVNWLDGRGVLAVTTGLNRHGKPGCLIACPHPKFEGSVSQFRAWYQTLNG